ncbi:hypothetical protein O7627_35100 [Solwaraspora sp. WMMD1047]|uniref:hypothetical protein n=1 Tax=Solwaraspora sp. WMMD1047 TaxID=3016102 RepID=UPI002416820F|nr:hypothetical protein [Solwaraspora sp. WMMD1047]MDG4834498.1 hypothetical protein [Solwaraspora sp. WMMD1047]
MTPKTTAGWRHRAARAAVLVLAAGSLAAGITEPASASVVRQPLTGLELVSYTTVSNSDPWFKFASKTCPNNKTVVGTGWSTNPSTSQLRLQFLKPYEHSVTAQVFEAYSGYDSPWSLTVYAMCADRPPGWSLTSTTDTTDSDDYHSAYVDCPGTTVPLAGGVEHMVPHGQAVVTDIDIDLTGVRASAYEHEDGYDDDWWVRAYAICADPPTGWELRSSSNQTAYPTTSETVGCSANRTAIGAGADLNGAYGEVVLKSLKTFAYGGGEYAMATASEDATGAPDTWTFTTDVICVDQ